MLACGMQDYRRLLVWQKAHALALEIQSLTEQWPRARNAALVSQMRRAGLSVPANIAEGCVRASDREFARFLQIALGSAVELEYHLEFAADARIMARAGYESVQPRINEVRRMLVGLMKRLRGPAVAKSRVVSHEGKSSS